MPTDTTPPPKLAPLKAAIVPVTPFDQNCTLLWNSETMRGAVVDPGGDVERIREAIKETGMTVEKILLTHGHLDHVGGAVDLAAALGVGIEGPHLADKFLMEGVEAQSRSYSLSGMKNATTGRWLVEGDRVVAGGHTFEVLHCPGHSPGSVVFFDRVQRVALVGDVIFAGSIGRTDLPYGDHDLLIAAIRTKLLPLGDDVAFICGHGPTSTLGRERHSNPYIQ